MPKQRRCQDTDFNYELTDWLSDKPGLSYPYVDSGLYNRMLTKFPSYPLPRYVVIRPREYYRDFKNGVERYYSDLVESMNVKVMSEADFAKKDLATKFMNAMFVRLQPSIAA